MALDRANGYRDMRVWDGVTGANIHLDSALIKDYGADQNVKENTIAYMVENLNLQSAALKRLEECRTQGAHIDLIQKVKVAGIEKSLVDLPAEKEGLDLHDWPTVHLDSGKKLKARLLVSHRAVYMKITILTLGGFRLVLMVLIVLYVVLQRSILLVGIMMLKVL